MFHRLKHYDGLLNLDKFTRIEKDTETTYKIKPTRHLGTTRNDTETTETYVIRFYTPEGYGGVSTSIEYDDESKRNEDFELISSLLCPQRLDS